MTYPAKKPPSPPALTNGGRIESPTALIFDLDGTLIDSAPDLQRCLNLRLATYGLAPLSLDDIHSMVGDGVAQLIERAFTARSHPLADLHKEVRDFMNLYEAEAVVLTKIYEGVVQTLDTLAQQGIRLAISTNKPERVALVVLERLGLNRHFGYVIGGDSRAYRKPDPRMLSEILDHFGVDASRCPLVGDSEVDSETAHAANAPFVLVNYGYRRGPASEIPAHARIDKFEELLALTQN